MKQPICTPSSAHDMVAAAGHPGWLHAAVAVQGDALACNHLVHERVAARVPGGAVLKLVTVSAHTPGRIRSSCRPPPAAEGYSSIAISPGHVPAAIPAAERPGTAHARESCDRPCAGQCRHQLAYTAGQCVMQNGDRNHSPLLPAHQGCTTAVWHQTTRYS